MKHKKLDINAPIYYCVHPYHRVFQGNLKQIAEEWYPPSEIRY